MPYLDGYLLYIPRIGILALLDTKIAQALRTDVCRAQMSSAILAELGERLSFPAQWQDILRQNACTTKDWAPISVTFSNTQKCTLRCKYCYADGGRLDDTDIDPNVAKAAIDLIVANAIATTKRASVVFLGEGEATANWSGFCAIIDYFRERCRTQKVSSFVHLSTNGVFSENKVDYLARI